MTQEQIELLSFIVDSTNAGAIAEDISDHFGISLSTAYSRLAILRKHDWAKRVRNDDNALVHVITKKGKDALQVVGANPEVRIKSTKQGVNQMAKTVRIDDDLVKELEQLMEEEDINTLTDAVDYALSDYFDLLEDKSEEEGEETASSEDW